ncbi:MAG: gliding motility protein GldN [Paludibacteraceae bacterium]|jgi:gliding motility associated protien GldN|nr:gliding motility protein GldN [Paludibacteraceae bacterium]MBQ2519716.1 gliding motility protein GldN [Paludibacteraceae bacterium]MBQ4018732.1 gliding motility protein GldN [Paludibacteraceae bacterium]
MMKRLSIIACTMLFVLTAQAQHKVISFFDEVGSARIRTEEFSQAHDTIVMIDHRIDDVIWSRFVYRIIDMRYKQNYQLYFPTKSDDPDYRNLFQVITDAVVDGLPIYEKNGETIKPEFRDADKNPIPPIARKNIPMLFMVDDPLGDYSDDPTHYDVSSSDYMLIHYDSVTDELSPHYYRFEPTIRNQLKYLVQEVTFFDKHTSRMHTKIMAIAPLHSDKIALRDSSNVIESLRQSIMFWIPFDALRPYLAMQYAIPNRNETKHVTYDEFFQKRLFSSYIVGEGNMYNRWIPDYTGDPEKIKQEQERIANELLNFEQDLWEY